MTTDCEFKNKMDKEARFVANSYKNLKKLYETAKVFECKGILRLFLL